MAGNNNQSSNLREALELYSNESRAEILNQLYALKRDQKLIDVVLIAGKDEERISAHRLLLSACSAYFRNRFTQTSTADQQIEIFINDVNGNDLDNIIKFCYTGILELGEDNAETLLTAAQQLEIPDVVKACRDFIARKIDSSNCNTTDESVTGHTQPMTETLLALMPWTEDLEIVPIQKYCPHTNKWTIWQKLEEKRIGFSVAMWDEEIIIAGGYIGGYIEGKAVNIVTSLNVKSMETKLLKPMGTCRNSSALVILDEYLYAIGGSFEGNRLKSVERWHRSTDTWSSVASMNDLRWGHEAIVFNNCIYVVGGRTATMESYDPKTNVWIMRAAMSEMRYFHGIAVLNNFLYAIGGISETVERYDPNTDTWAMMCPLNGARSEFGCITINDRLLIAGGTGTTNVDVYNPDENKWTRKSSLADDGGECILLLAKNIS